MSYLQTPSPMEPLKELCSSIPKWQEMLEKLNGEMDKRQAELAKAAQEFRPSPPSLRNKGSTESLRPANDPGNGIKDTDVEMTDGEQQRPTSAQPRLMRNSTSPGPIRTGSRSKAGVAKKIVAPAVRKRKTESLASIGSSKPKQRTRSMIIVYYDSAVQLAFEELVKHLSGARNVMRKGKIAERMAGMRQVAAVPMQADAGTDLLAADDDLEADGLAPTQTGPDANGAAMGTLTADNNLPRFVSNRRMAPAGIQSSAAARYSSRPMPMGVRAAMTTSGTPEKGVYDELDSGLEWCQNMCEHAAHQFLRDGTCKSEIRGISARLAEVVDRAKAEIERQKLLPQPVAAPQATPSPRVRSRPVAGRYQFAKFDMNKLDSLEADDLEASDGDSKKEPKTKEAKPIPPIDSNMMLEADDMCLEADDADSMNLEADDTPSPQAGGPLESGSNAEPQALVTVPGAAAHAARNGRGSAAGPVGAQGRAVPGQGDSYGGPKGKAGADGSGNAPTWTWPGRPKGPEGGASRTMRVPALRKGPVMVNGRRDVPAKEALKFDEVVLKTEKLTVVNKVMPVPDFDDMLEADSDVEVSSDSSEDDKLEVPRKSGEASDSSGHVAAADQLRRESERAEMAANGVSATH